MPLSRLIARPLLAAGFVVGGVSALRSAPQHAEKAAPVADRVVPAAKQAGIPLPEDPLALVRLNAGVQIAAGLALATGRAPRISSLVLAASLVPTTIAGHPFWAASDPSERGAHLLHFAKNSSMLGGLLIAAGDTEGKPGVAWRARRAAKDTRREAKHLARDARREAKHLASAAKREARLAKARAT
ncbi:DoxX family membrane protein [Nocardioides flavescens]|uniref:DoxX family membrane protein n=1 Tax=Nocardioides flavescens TaxID=2691959 RepID=A0A6L7EW98_9ACTN|nr:DoxX family protein [Nocardioides flavescens]MXG91693.1 DoxX family membrane protein [Nocardioides flavescens]